MCTKPSGATRRWRALALAPAMLAALAALNIPAVASALNRAAETVLSTTALSDGKISANIASEQESNAQKGMKSASAKSDADGSAIAVYSELPRYPGGEQAMYQFIAENMKYPRKAMEEGTEGSVVVAFTVTTDGSTADVKVVRPVSPELDAEAVRLIKAMPKWEPGIKDGKAFNAHYTLPLKFRLTGNKKKAAAETAPAAEPKQLDEVTIVGFSKDDICNEPNAPMPAIFIDNEKYTGELKDLDKDKIESMTVVKDDPEYPQGIIKIKLKK